MESKMAGTKVTHQRDGNQNSEKPYTKITRQMKGRMGEGWKGGREEDRE